MNDIRTAILKAADWIEKNPEQFAFTAIRVPECGTPGCALGWISHFYGVKARSYDYGRDVFEPLGISYDTDFYRRVDSLVASGWTRNPSLCAQGMRLYADKYHPALKELPSGAEVCRELIRKPFRESVEA